MVEMDEEFFKEVIRLSRGRSDEAFIQSILSKLSESGVDEINFCKMVMKLGTGVEGLIDKIAPIIFNKDLMRILSELEKPMKPSALGVIPAGERLEIAKNLQDYQDAPRSPSSIFAEGFMVPRWRRHRRQNEFECKKENKCSTPSAASLLDSTKFYGHREGYNLPRSVSERFETNAVKNLAKTSLKNPRLKKEYRVVKDLLKEGVHPVNLSHKSGYASATKVLVKKPEGRYIVDVSYIHANIVGVSSRTNAKYIEKFEALMNKLYDLDLKGYL